MGNVCCGYFGLEHSEKRENGVKRISHSRIISTENKEEIDLFGLIGAQQIENMLKESQDFFNTDSFNDKKHVLLNEKVKLTNSSYVFRAHFSELPSGNKLHHYLHTFEPPFTSDMLILYSFQQNLESVNKLDDSLDAFEVLCFSCRDDIAIFVILTRTKKILLIEPRSFLLVRIVKRVSENEFIECQKSLHLINELKDVPFFANKISQIVNMGEMQLGGVWGRSVEGKVVETSFSKVDVLSSTGGVLLKPFLKKKFFNMFKNRTKEITKFALSTKVEDFNQLRWFTNDNAKFQELFAKNKTVIQLNGINVSELEGKEATEISVFLSKNNDELSESSSIGSEKQKNAQEEVKDTGLRVSEIKTDTEKLLDETPKEAQLVVEEEVKTDSVQPDVQINETPKQTEATVESEERKEEAPVEEQVENPQKETLENPEKIENKEEASEQQQTTETNSQEQGQKIETSQDVPKIEGNTKEEEKDEVGNGKKGAEKKKKKQNKSKNN